MLFWSCEDQAFLSCTDARPEQQRSFNPVARYHASGPWRGLGAPAQATGHRVLLAGAQINAAGRLSAADSTSATVQMLDQTLDQTLDSAMGQQLKPCKSWVELLKARSLNQRSLLAEPQPMKDWVVLQPERFGAARFDPARQTLVWPLFDQQENRIDAELVYSEYNAHAIVRIEQFLPGQLVPGIMLVAHVRHGAAGVVLDPLSLVRSHCQPGENPVDALHFDKAAESGFVSTFLSKINPVAVLPGTGQDETLTAPAHLLQCLAELRHGLQRQAERGLAADFAAQSLAQMASWADQATVAGLNAFSQLNHGANHAALRLLQMNYLFLQYLRLLEEGDPQ